MPPKEKYTDPKLRDQIKEELHNSDKGGAPGQWSARKAQMMASEYKKRGGEYNTEKKDQDESQKHLSEWGEEDWQTREGSGHAKKADGTEKRYLPKKAWEKMSEHEKDATEKEKEQGSKRGKQHVANTGKAKQSRKEAEEDTHIDDVDSTANGGDTSGRKKSGKTATKTSKDDNGGGKDVGKDSDSGPQTRSRKRTRSSRTADEDGDDGKDDDEAHDAKTSRQKKTKSSSSGNGNATRNSHGVDGKSTYGSKHQSTEAPAAQGSNERLPKKGQKVTWKAMPGWVEGEVIEVVTSSKTVEGKSVKGSEKEPRIVLRSHGPSGKVAVHKPDAVFFD